jgi:hypothetical protein
MTAVEMLNCMPIQEVAMGRAGLRMGRDATASLPQATTAVIRTRSTSCKAEEPRKVEEDLLALCAVLEEGTPSRTVSPVVTAGFS